MSESEKTIELGVFIPVGNGGWIPSVNSPDIRSTYGYNREVTLLAEELGLDFALSMAKWRGYGGSTRHWDFTLESMTTMAGLAEATSRIGIWATVHTMVFHPAVVAKMAATMDQISGGRFGLNLVAGSNPYDQGQMGLWRDLSHDGRYALAREWITVARRLWTEERVDHSGEFFQLTDCVSNPKPVRTPQVICAGTSDTGFRFTIENCDGCFISGNNPQSLVRTGQRAKRIAAELGRTTKTYGLFTVVPGETDEAARARVDHFNAGVDVEALRRQAGEYATDVRENTMRQRMVQRAERPTAVGDGAVVGSPETIARQLAGLVRDADLDGVTVIVPDFIDDLRTVGERVAPLMAGYGVRSRAAGTAAGVGGAA
ncbi:LLM class flavin-dependent oxidoreductase [Phytohabitans kaempferiae]|uniref:LLM class flavin-dependent oxidoreductase n=1 Tax=Phytohabitans kaempferiae TaxID=1620943 RepID=A0ABV6MID6_9ACTN